MRREASLWPGLERILGDDSDQTWRVDYRTNFQSRRLKRRSAAGRAGTWWADFSFYNRAEVR